MNIKIINSGLLTIVEDMGRYGYQASGMQVSGVMDKYAAELANALVGNPPQAAVLEATYLGPEIEAEGDVLVAVTGGIPEVIVDGQMVNPYESIELHQGQHLLVAGMREGLRAYIAIAGGLSVPQVLGSRSTNMKLGIGGVAGKKLINGTELPVGEPSIIAREILTGHAHHRHAAYNYLVDNKIWSSDFHHIRLVLGPQADYFTEESIKALNGAIYTVSKDSDRMGYRLEGAAIQRKNTRDMITDGIVFGSIQVPPGGQPIVMMADHQTTGGYPKIGTVITADLPLLAQCKPGTRICFEVVSVYEAQKIYISYMKAVQEQIRLMDSSMESFDWPEARLGVRNYQLKIDGQLFRVSVEKI